MSAYLLFLYSRKGCCLCDGLEQRLRGLNLDKLTPCLSLHVIDIDQKSTPDFVRERYHLEVPVLVIGSPSEENRLVVLPRVSPRLEGTGLFNWLQKECTNALGSD